MTTEKTLAEEIGLTKEEARTVGEMACELVESGDLEGGRQMLETLVMINPKDSAMTTALGTVYQKLQMFTEADAAYSAAIDTADHLFARVHRGELRLSQGDARGFADLQAVLKVDPKAASLPAIHAKHLLDARARVPANKAAKR